jgi:hypothetical protein
MRNAIQILVLLVVLSLDSCEEIEGPKGLNSLINLTDEPSGSNCAEGGQKIEVGIDQNGNNQLDQNEVQSTKYSCNGADGTGAPDKQVRLDFGFGSTILNTTSVVPSISPQETNILRFNRDNYQGVDSIIFASKMWSRVANNKCYVELFNVTDNAPIAGTLLETSSTNDLDNYLFSMDVKSNFPSKEITLGLRIRSEKEGDMVSVFRANLFIYKK